MGLGALRWRDNGSWHFLGFLVLGALAVGATASAYRAVLEHRGSDPRGTLIGAALVGISCFVSMISLLTWVDRTQAVTKFRATETRRTHNRTS
ncbi:unnamed protein product [uncultured bacterium]|nr:unnamed protein product [uncultured bacterium]